MHMLMKWASLYLTDIKYFRDRITTKWQTLKDVRLLYLRWLFNRKKQYLFIADYQRFLRTSSPSAACKAIIVGVVKSGDDTLKAHVAQSILNALDEGEPACVGMQKWFNKDLLQIYRAAEQSKKVTQVLDVYIAQEKGLIEYRQKLFGSLFVQAYFVIVGTAIALLAANNNFFGFEDITPLNRWEPMSLLARDMAIFIESYLSVIALAIMGVQRAYKVFTDNTTARWRLQLDNYFPLNIYKTFAFLRIFKLITVLKSTHKGDFDAIEIAHVNGSRYTRHFTGKMKTKMNKGEDNLGVIVDTGLFPPRLISRVTAIANLASEDARNEALIDISNDSEAEANIMMGRSRVLIAVIAWLLSGTYVAIIIAGFALVVIGNTSI